jgi:phosphoribosylanthranilate isomerase
MAAAEAGADAIGIVLHRQSKRHVTLTKAREIVQAVGPMVSVVGLFVDAAVDEIRKTADELRLHHLQLHGAESSEVVGGLGEFQIIKAVRVDPATIREELHLWQQARLKNLCGLVLETAGKAVGGSGVENDWKLIATLMAEGAFAGLPPIIVAGGLTPSNVRQVVRDLRPYAVDVSSGVESNYGEKSVEKMREFVAEVRAADEDRN